MQLIGQKKDLDGELLSLVATVSSQFRGGRK